MRCAILLLASLLTRHVSLCQTSFAQPTDAPAPRGILTQESLSTRDPTDLESDFPSVTPITAISDSPSSVPTVVTPAPDETVLCFEQELLFRQCLNTTLSLEIAGHCDDCVAASFPQQPSVCPLFQSSVCSALARNCDCGMCATAIESYVDCALANVREDGCQLDCNYETCDYPRFQFTSCMETSGFGMVEVATCVECARNALISGGPISSCSEAADRVCPAIISECGCGNCRAELETFLVCDAVGREIPSNCTLECEIVTVSETGADGDEPPAASDNSGEWESLSVRPIGLVSLVIVLSMLF